MLHSAPLPRDTLSRLSPVGTSYPKMQRLCAFHGAFDAFWRSSLPEIGFAERFTLQAARSSLGSVLEQAFSASRPGGTESSPGTPWETARCVVRVERAVVPHARLLDISPSEIDEECLERNAAFFERREPMRSSAGSYVPP